MERAEKALVTSLGRSPLNNKQTHRREELKFGASSATAARFLYPQDGAITMTNRRQDSAAVVARAVLQIVVQHIANIADDAALHEQIANLLGDEFFDAERPAERESDDA
jgi:hypothetical protein